MQKPRVRIYTDYKSPYAFVANKRPFNDELFWGGDRIDLLIERIQIRETITTALGSWQLS